MHRNTRCFIALLVAVVVLYGCAAVIDYQRAEPAGYEPACEGLPGMIGDDC